MKCPKCGCEVEFGLKLKEPIDWRKEKATPNQLKTLDNMKVPYTPNITKGEADELIKAHNYNKENQGYY